MPTACYAMVRGRVARFTRLDARGAPVEGPGSVVLTSGISKVEITERSTTQNTDLLRSDRDDPRLLLRGKTQTLGYDANITLCGVNPDLISLVTGMPVVENAAGDVVGNDAQMKLPVASFAMEVWSMLDRPVNGYRYGYTVFPRLRGGRLGGVSFGRGTVDFQITGAKTIRGSRWSTGPYTLRWMGDGWDLNPWDTEPWDGTTNPFGCLGDGAVSIGGEGFGIDEFGVSPFGGALEGSVVHERLGTPIGGHTHWRNFLLDWAPAAGACGSYTLSDAVDNAFADPTTQSSDVVDGQFVYTTDDILDGGYA